MISRSITLLFTLSGFLVISNQAQIILEDVSYIKACSISDPEINKCLLNSANEAWKVMREGRKDLPSPTFVPYWDIPVSGGQLAEDFFYIQNNTKLYDFDTMNFIDATYNKEENSMLFTYEIPIQRFTSDYEMDVQFLGQHIYGKGDMICKLDNNQHYIKIALRELTWERYAVKDTSFNISVQKVDVEFNNLFNGDVKKGEEANKLINENRKAFFGFVARGWTSYLNKTLREMVDALVQIVPKDKLLKP